MSKSIPTFDEYRAELQYLIRRTRLSLKNAPEGSLHIKTNRRTPQFYHRVAGKKDVYIPQENMSFVRRLAQKAYDQKVSGLLNTLNKRVDKMVHQFPMEGAGNMDASLLYSDLYQSLDRIYDKQGEIRQNLIIPVIPTTKQFAEAWLAEPYERLPFRDTDHSRYYSKGLGRVRSKSELHIADRLFYGRYPSRYEYPLYLENVTLHPDFTVLDTHTRRVKYIEHCGMMGDPIYTDTFIKKINTYEANGIFSGEDLLLTYESAELPFDTRTFDRLLAHHFREPLEW